MLRFRHHAHHLRARSLCRSPERRAALDGAGGAGTGADIAKPPKSPRREQRCCLVAGGGIVRQNAVDTRH